MEQLYNIWERRNPKWEEKFRDLITQFTEYGVGSTSQAEARAKQLGAGYEMYIYAFFLGLYFNRRRELSDKTDVFGHSVGNWEGKDVLTTGRKKYPRLKEYIFAILIAKTDDLDFIGLEKGNVKPSKIVDALILTMEEYANYGFQMIEDKLKDNPGYFDTHTGFLDFLLSAVDANKEKHEKVLEEL